MKQAITTYEAITRQKLAGQWDASLQLFPQAFTLDIYYHIYQAVEEYEPERTYGYRKRICANMQICSDLWGGVSKERRNAFRRYAKASAQNDGKNRIRLGYGRVVQVNRLGCGVTVHCSSATLARRAVSVRLG